jgi:hypothetical protein
MGFIVDLFTGDKAKDAIKDSQNLIINESKATRDAQVGNANQYFDYARGQTNPFYQTGANSLGGVNAFTTPGADLSSFLASDPGYAASVREGQNAVASSQAVRGLLNSGSTLKALTRFGQDNANQHLDQIFGRYMAGAGIGQNALGQQLLAGQFATSQKNNALNFDMDRRASAYATKGEARSDFWGGVGGSLNNSANMFAKLIGGF